MNPIRLLIVHPDPAASALLTEMLRTLGFAIEETADPEVATRSLCGGVSLVLAFHGSLGPISRGIRSHPGTPVVVLVDTLEAGRPAAAKWLGVPSLLKWPCGTGALRATVLQALGLDALPRAQAPRVAPAPAPSPPASPPFASSAAERATRAGQSPSRPRPPKLRKLRDALSAPERRIIARALEAFGGNREKTARALDIDRTTLHKKMRRLGLLAGGPTSEVGD